MSKLKQKLQEKWYALFGGGPEPIIKAIPDFETAKRYEHEESFYVLYMFCFIALFVAWIYFTPDLIDLLLVYFPSIGPIPGFWIVNIMFGLGCLTLGALIRQAKINYYHKLLQRANAYPVWTGTITEMEETGFTTKYFQLAIKDIRRVATGNQEIQLHTNPGSMTLNPNDNMYIVTTAYTDEDDLLHQFPLITEHSVDDHTTLTRFEDVFFGWLGVKRLVSKLHLVVPQRIQDQRPVMYVAHSGVTVEQILQRQTPKLVDEQEIYAAERLSALTQGERVIQENVQLKARIEELEQQNRNLRLALLRKQQDERKEKSSILTPEPEKVPLIGLTGWKLHLFYAIIGIIIVLLIIFGGSYFALW